MIQYFFQPSDMNAVLTSFQYKYHSMCKQYTTCRVSKLSEQAFHWLSLQVDHIIDLVKPSIDDY